MYIRHIIIFLHIYIHNFLINGNMAKLVLCHLSVDKIVSPCLYQESLSHSSQGLPHISVYGFNHNLSDLNVHQLNSIATLEFGAIPNNAFTLFIIYSHKCNSLYFCNIATWPLQMIVVPWSQKDTISRVSWMCHGCYLSDTALL
jgi:hypothetical protein